MDIIEDHYKRILLNPHERVFLNSTNGTSDSVQVDALHDGTLFFSGGNSIISGFEGINPEEIKTFEDKQPFAVLRENTIVVEGNGIVLTTPESETSNTCVYVTSDAEGKLTISGGQNMIYGTTCIDLSKFFNQIARK